MAMDGMELIQNIILLVVVAWAVGLSVVFYRAYAAFRNLTKGITKKDLKSVLTKLANSLKDLKDETGVIGEEIEAIQADARKHLQKIGFLRFNPFSDTGGNQSFCLCLLDNNNDGIVITSLHSRDQTRIYTKSIEAGFSKAQELSKEEKQAVLMATRSGKKNNKK